MAVCLSTLPLLVTNLCLGGVIEGGDEEVPKDEKSHPDTGGAHPELDHLREVVAAIATERRP